MMQLAVSNIAWTNEEEVPIANLLQQLGVKYVELAPTKQWLDPTTASDKELSEYKKFWTSRGMNIVAFQSMLFNRPDLKIFESESLRDETREYLQKFIALAPKLGAGVLVFGSPKNRQKGDLRTNEAQAIAKDFFDALGDAAQSQQTIFCIEPNPTDYACDFVTNATEGITIVRTVNNSGFGLHLDLAGMTLAGDDIATSIRSAGSLLKHFHISAPYLEQVEERDDVDYRLAAQTLHEVGYDNFVSIEMKPGPAGENMARVETAVKFVQKIFGV
jgi:D-psicose/D-tagatose/L-ribulose 3-epimerase